MLTSTYLEENYMNNYFLYIKGQGRRKIIYENDIWVFTDTHQPVPETVLRKYYATGAIPTNPDLVNSK